MRRLLVTGADGFVGRHLVRAARAGGWQVTAAILPGGTAPDRWLTPVEAAGVETIHGDLRDPAAVDRIAAAPADAVVHLAAIASGAAARRDPAAAGAVNEGGTAALAEALGATARRPTVLLASTAEVYGAGHEGAIAESAPVHPVSPYGASKAAAERALLAAGDRHGLPVVVARPFPHTGPGQDTRFVLPAFAARLREARASGEHEVPVGNLDVTRDFLDVRDVVRAYLLLVERGEPGECYNVATGTGRHLEACFRSLAAIIGVDAVPVRDPALVRPADITCLVGDPAKLTATTGWRPTIDFTQTLQDLVDAQAD